MKVETAYDLWSKQYDSIGNRTRDLDKYVTKETLRNYEFDRVIELGSGTGKNTIYLLERASQIIGLDFSQEMLKRATKKITDNGVEFRQRNIKYGWGIDKEFADLITSNLTLEHIEDLDFIFEQASLSLKPNGYFFIYELHPYKQYLGSKARFDHDGETIELEVYTHHITDYLASAQTVGFKLLEIKEWFDKQPFDKQPFDEQPLSEDPSHRESIAVQPPRLISIMFQKS